MYDRSTPWLQGSPGAGSGHRVRLMRSRRSAQTSSPTSITKRSTVIDTTLGTGSDVGQVPCRSVDAYLSHGRWMSTGNSSRIGAGRWLFMYARSDSSSGSRIIPIAIGILFLRDPGAGVRADRVPLLLGERDRGQRDDLLLLVVEVASAARR